MFCSIADTITQTLLRIFKSEELVTVLISILPIVEARGAIPVAINAGITPLLAGLYAFIGSSLMAPVLIAVLLPFVKWLSRTKVFRKVGQTLYDKFEKKSQGILKDEQGAEGPPDAQAKKKSDKKKMLGVFAFVAVPLPLTGVWTGSAVSAFTRLPYAKVLVSVIAGNLVASAIITLLCYFFQPFIDWIILAIGIIAIAVVLVLIIKIILHKPKTPVADENGNKEEND